jgi:HK97 gp10 family phage protein
MEVELLGVGEIMKRLKDLANLITLTKTNTAFVKGAIIVKKEAVAELKNNVHIRGYSIDSIKYGLMDKGIKVVKYTKTIGAQVHIMGDFRLRFFEKGTAQRYYKGQNRGSIKATHFFKKAQDRSALNAYNQIIQELDKLIKETINKVG